MGFGFLRGEANGARETDNIVTVIRRMGMKRTVCLFSVCKRGFWMRGGRLVLRMRGQYLQARVRSRCWKFLAVGLAFGAVFGLTLV